MIVIVIGGHRSGTSCVAGVLEALGVAMGGPGDVAPSNPRGHYEDGDFLRLHRLILGELADAGRPADPHAWRHPRPDFGPYRAAYASLVAAREVAGGPWGVKDPRLCVLWPCLRDCLVGSARVVHVVRPLDQVARSLWAREHATDPAFRIEHADAVAERYAAAAWRAVAGLAPAAPVLTLDYPAAVRRPAEAVAVLAAFVAVPVTPAAAAAIDPALKHH